MKKILNILFLIILMYLGINNIISCKNNTKQKKIILNNKNIPINNFKNYINKEKNEKNIQRNKKNIDYEKEFYFYKKFKKSIISFDVLKYEIISFFNDNYDNIFFITNNGLYLLIKKENKITKINNINNSNIWCINFDSKNNMYFAVYNIEFGSSFGEAYVLKNGKNNAQKINGINERIFNITIDNYDNVYYDLNNGLYIFNSKKNSLLFCEFIKKYGFYKKTLGFDGENNMYFSTLNNIYVLKNNKNKPIKIDNLNNEVTSLFINKNKIYFATNKGAFFLKQGKTKALKINKIKFLNKDDKINYFLFDKKYIYIGCLYQTYILDYDYKIIKLLPSSHCFKYIYDNKIYFGSDRGIYKFNLNLMNYERIKIKNNNNFYNTDDYVICIYYINDNLYFEEYTRKNINFYKINNNNIAEKIENFNNLFN